MANFATVETLQKKGFLVGTTGSMDVYSYQGDRYLILKDSQGNPERVTVIGGFYKK